MTFVKKIDTQSSWKRPPSIASCADRRKQQRPEKPWIPLRAQLRPWKAASLSYPGRPQSPGLFDPHPPLPLPNLLFKAFSSSPYKDEVQTENYWAEWAGRKFVGSGRAGSVRAPPVSGRAIPPSEEKSLKAGGGTWACLTNKNLVYSYIIKGLSEKKAPVPL